jgi:hypothetical protein
VSDKVRFKIFAVFEVEREWLEDDYDVPIVDILAEAREHPDDWALDNVLDDGLKVFRIIEQRTPDPNCERCHGDGEVTQDASDRSYTVEACTCVTGEVS